MAPREPSFGIREDLLPLVLTPLLHAEASWGPSGSPWLGEGWAEEGPFAWCFPAAPTGLCVYLLHLKPAPQGSSTHHGFSSHLAPQLAAAMLVIPYGGITVLTQPHRSGDPTHLAAQGVYLSSTFCTPSPQCQHLSRGPPFLCWTGLPAACVSSLPSSAHSACFAKAGRFDFVRLWLRVSRWLLSTMGLQMVPPGSFWTLHSIWRCHNFYQTLSFGSPSSIPPPPTPDKWVLLLSSW